MADAIRKLREAVEAGAISTDLIMDALGDGWTDIHVLAAFDGNLDAAKALHDALLPGWGWSKTSDGLVVVLLWDAGGVRAKSSSSNPIIARAWLLAILRAMEAEKPE